MDTQNPKKGKKGVWLAVVAVLVVVAVGLVAVGMQEGGFLQGSIKSLGLVRAPAEPALKAGELRAANGKVYALKNIATLSIIAADATLPSIEKLQMLESGKAQFVENTLGYRTYLAAERMLKLAAENPSIKGGVEKLLIKRGEELATFNFSTPARAVKMFEKKGPEQLADYKKGAVAYGKPFLAYHFETPTVMRNFYLFSPNEPALGAATPWAMKQDRSIYPLSFKWTDGMYALEGFQDTAIIDIGFSGQAIPKLFYISGDAMDPSTFIEEAF